MEQIEPIRLRGYDSYTVTLGDEIRGRRATLGKTLLDVQRDLRIKAAHIEAIENADIAAIPYVGFVTGYVRAYARYLGMDEDDMLRRFCEEAKFRPQTSLREERPRALSAAVAVAPQADLDALIAGSRLAAASRAEALSSELGATLRAVGSLAVLVALVGGLGYGAWAILQNIQRVDFAPAPDAPGASADAPALAGLGGAFGADFAPPAVDAKALAAIYAAQEAPPPLSPRDGPIFDLDPARAGVYVHAPAELASPRPMAASVAAPAASAVAERPTAEGAVAAKPEPAETPAPEPAATPAASVEEPERIDGGPERVALVFEQEAWVRVRDVAGRIVHERLMGAGSRWEAPRGRDGLSLRAGNAGGVRVEIGGALYGPLGAPGALVKDLSLEAQTVRASLPLLRSAD